MLAKLLLQYFYRAKDSLDVFNFYIISKLSFCSTKHKDIGTLYILLGSFCGIIGTVYSTLISLGFFLFFTFVSLTGIVLANAGLDMGLWIYESICVIEPVLTQFNVTNTFVVNPTLDAEMVEKLPTVQESDPQVEEEPLGIEEPTLLLGENKSPIVQESDPQVDEDLFSMEDLILLYILQTHLFLLLCP
jgi:hypothetical protein